MRLGGWSEGDAYVEASVCGVVERTGLRGEMGTGVEEMRVGSEDAMTMRQRVREGMGMSMLAKVSESLVV